MSLTCRAPCSPRGGRGPHNSSGFLHCGSRFQSVRVTTVSRRCRWAQAAMLAEPFHAAYSFARPPRRVCCKAGRSRPDLHPCEGEGRVVADDDAYLGGRRETVLTQQIHGENHLVSGSLVFAKTVPAVSESCRQRVALEDIAAAQPAAAAPAFGHSTDWLLPASVPKQGRPADCGPRCRVAVGELVRETERGFLACHKY